jgi:hypothetical protein
LLCDFTSANISCDKSDCTITVTKTIRELLLETSYCQAYVSEDIGKYEKINLEPPKFTEKRDLELPRLPHEKNPSDDGVSSILDQLFQKPFGRICFMIVQMGLISSQLIAIVILSQLI